MALTSPSRRRLLVVVGGAAGLVVMVAGGLMHNKPRLPPVPVPAPVQKPVEKLNRQQGRADIPSASIIQVLGDDPQAVLHAYIAALEQGKGGSDLSIYTQATKKMFLEWVVTPAQMDNEAKNYRKCTGEEVRMKGDLAVVRFNVRERNCSPYFLRREDGAWKLDFTLMQGAVSFNVNNEWHFKPEIPHDFGFAFTDWRFDADGFPHPEK